MTTVRAVTVAVTKSGHADVTPPITTGLKGPKNVKRGRPAVFRFGSSEAGGTFRCKVDRKPSKTCASPFRVKTGKLGSGRKHTFSVFAVNLAGNADATP